ncbi:MAG: dUTP diphosphatase [Proteobacteria bacterium]|nr:dUTP diphosphatase [Pseudomonadota bacterium]
MSGITVDVMRLPHGQGLALPAHATSGSAGMDLLAAVEAAEIIEPGQRSMVPTGLAIALPEGFEAQVRPRSGLAAKHGITILNSPGTIDADYRGEVKVILINHGHEPFTIRRGDRIAQMVVAPVQRWHWRDSDALPESGRGEGGFGSTGIQES